MLDKIIFLIFVCFYFFCQRNLSPVVESIVSFTSLLMTNSLTVVAKVFSNTLIFFQQKTSMYLAYFKIEILTSHQLTASLSFEQLSPETLADI